MPKPFIILVAGHNSVRDEGDPVERSLTPKLAAAYLKVFRDAGYRTVWINPTMYPGGLTGLALATGREVANAVEDMTIVFDLHFNTAHSRVHVVVPHNVRQDGKGMLASAFPQGRVESDTADNNKLDVRFAKTLAANIAKANGLQVISDMGYGPGVMPENRTRVGEPPINSRLAMNGATAPYRMKAVRVTVEHGGTSDADKPEFFERCAIAALSTVEQVIVSRIITPDVNPPGIPDQSELVVPPLLAFLFGEAQGYTYDPNGPVSKLWNIVGVSTGHWPRLVDVRIVGDDKWFVFGNGTIIYVESGKPPVQLTKVVDNAK